MNRRRIPMLSKEEKRFAAKEKKRIEAQIASAEYGQTRAHARDFLKRAELIVAFVRWGEGKNRNVVFFRISRSSARCTLYCGDPGDPLPSEFRPHAKALFIGEIDAVLCMEAAA